MKNSRAGNVWTMRKVSVETCEWSCLFGGKFEENASNLHTAWEGEKTMKVSTRKLAEK